METIKSYYYKAKAHLATYPADTLATVVLIGAIVVVVGFLLF